MHNLPDFEFKSIAILCSINANTNKFGWEDGDAPEIGSNVKSRFIVLYLENLTQDQHTFKVLVSMETPVDTGLDVMQPGTQEHIVNFTVAEPENYPILSYPISTGQNRYRSEETGFDYLLYVPDDFGVDPQKKWPLILYLLRSFQILGMMWIVNKFTLRSYSHGYWNRSKDITENRRT